MDASHVYVRARTLGCFHSLNYQYPNLSESADRVGGQLRGDKEGPFSGVTNFGRVWRTVPESAARSVGPEKVGRKEERLCDISITNSVMVVVHDEGGKVAGGVKQVFCRSLTWNQTPHHKPYNCPPPTLDPPSFFFFFFFFSFFSFFFFQSYAPPRFQHVH